MIYQILSDILYYAVHYGAGAMTVGILTVLAAGFLMFVVLKMFYDMFRNVQENITSLFRAQTCSISS